MGSKPMVAPTSTPSAWIVTNNRKDKSQPSDKGRKSVKNGKVYLDDGQEFEIELHNPLTECVLCDIKLNGQSISKNGLVLRPGQRFYLDCFIDDKKKFIFSTYEVENTLEASDSIVKNGLLEVFFYKEDVVQISDWRRRFDRVIVEKHYYPTYPYWTAYPSIYYGTGYPLSYGSCTTTIGNSGAIGLTTNTVTLNSSRGSAIGSTTTSVNDNGSLFSATSNTSNAMYTSNSGTVDLTNSMGTLLGGMNSTPISASLNANIETGRVEKGTASSQKFKEVDMQFQSMYISQTILQILPTSVKPVEVKELVKVNEEDGTVTVKVKKDSNDVIELIKKLADLHTAGILTDDEFNNKKSELLSKI